MPNSPTNIRAVREAGVFEIDWAEGGTSRYRFPFLRRQCPCASCVDEFSGRRILDPTTVPEDITPVDVKLVGNYALGIHWSDGHHTGLFTWEYLNQLRPAAESDLLASAGAETAGPS